MRIRRFLKNDNRGASLIAVLIAIAVVSVIGAVVTNMTITNIQMKEIERQAKVNFYDAETVMENLSAGLNKLASGEMEKAYNKMLAQYRNVSEGGGSVKKSFSKYYLNYMIALFTPSSASSPLMEYNTENSELLYQRGDYSLDTVKNAFLDDALKAKKDEIVVTSAADARYFADYDEGVFVLENVTIYWPDELGNATKIKTDVVFHTPELNFDGSKLVKEFMRYSLIADDGINVDCPSVKVHGNAYAGADGIFTTNTSDAVFDGKKVITRGNITVSSLGNLFFGMTSDLNNTQIWTENIKTVKTEETATFANRPVVTLAGNIYVSDDLEMEGEKDKVVLMGKYYGYNFQQNYDDAVRPTDAQYSSSIVINGRESDLDFSGLTSLMIAGRTFIERNKNTTEAKSVPLGESLAVRTSQIAYYVPRDYVVDEVNLKLDCAKYAKDFLGITDSTFDLGVYLASQNVIKYYYTESGGGTPFVFYLNFASESMANQYYSLYFSKRSSDVTEKAKKYLTDDALQLDSTTIQTLRGDILYRDKDDPTHTLKEKSVIIDESLWGKDATYFNFAANHARKYTSLQKYLEDSHTDILLSDVRLSDKTSDGIFDSLFNSTRLTSFFDAHEEDGRKLVQEWTEAGSGKKLLAIVDGDYEVKSDYTGGLVIATGNVTVATGNGATKFKGTIISKGTIDFSTGAEVDSDEVLVSQMIAKDLLKAVPEFATILEGYEEAVETAMGEASIDKYLTYEGWTKTVE